MVRLFNKGNGNSCVLLVWGIIEKGLHLGKVPKGVVPGASVSGLGGGAPPLNTQTHTWTRNECYFLVWLLSFQESFTHSENCTCILVVNACLCVSKRFLHILKSVHAYWLWMHAYVFFFPFLCACSNCTGKEHCTGSLKWKTIFLINWKMISFWMPILWKIMPKGLTC